MLKHPHLWRLLTLALRNVLLNQIKIIMFLNNLVCRKLVQRTNFFTTSYLYLWCNFVKRNIFQILRSVYDFGPAIIRLGRHTCTYNDIWWKRLLFEGAFKESKQQFPLTNHVCHQRRMSILDDFEKHQFMPHVLLYVCLLSCPIPIHFRFLPPTVSTRGNQFMIKSRLWFGQVKVKVWCSAHPRHIIDSHSSASLIR